MDKAATNMYIENEYDFIKNTNIKEIKVNFFYRVSKRCGDIIFALLLLPFAAVFILFFAILIRIETPGPSLYVQERVGKQGRFFKLYKLRSMTNNAEKNGAQWAVQNDPRVTKVGAFIRKTRIDELPQLFNVLKGDMSVVGPRPERPLFTVQFEQEIPGFIQRLSVKPGLTGWAQVNGGYEMTPEEKIQFDMVYIQQQSFILDMKILLKTIRVVLTGEGAR